ncbi:GNAT family N-acetyltransferase [Motilibacter rhizosphaerae]|uniref:GNAT family N-acetyltransferase n=1 Tax=Motilibacter rhizosphaerae TaxID=598652 RepID=UPI00102C200B
MRTSALRLLNVADTAEALALVDGDPVTNAFVGARLHAVGLNGWRLGAEVWGWAPDGVLRSLCYAGANLIPVAADAEAVEAYAERARASGRRCSSIVGPAEAVLDLWARLEPSWGPARELRPCQPLLATSRPSPVLADPLVRRVRPDELDVLLPASLAMYTEEIGVSPLAGDGGALYRARVAELVAAGRAFARIEDGSVVFKAEVGAVVPGACQVQGVWVRPDRRGEGLSVAGMAAVVDAALRDIAPVVSLYVNDFNAPARAAYARVGFEQVGTFASVLF